MPVSPTAVCQPWPPLPVPGARGAGDRCKERAHLPARPRADLSERRQAVPREYLYLEGWQSRYKSLGGDSTGHHGW